MDDRAARLRRSITFFVICSLFGFGLFVFYLTRSPELARVATASAPVAPPAPKPVDPSQYVWDGTWLEAQIEAGATNNNSIVLPIPDNSRVIVQTEGYGTLFEFVCTKKIQNFPVEGFEETPCVDGATRFFQFKSLNGERQVIRYHFGPYKE